MRDYTTTDKIKVIESDATKTKEEKDAEKAKTVISNDAFAICDFLESKLEHLRLSLIG